VFLAIVAADLFGYFLGMKLGNAVFERMLTKFSLTRKAFRSAGIYFEKYKEKAIIFTRPLIGVRIAVPILAGHFGVDFRKFLKYDIFAAAAWSVFWITLSYSLGSGLSLITKVKEVRHMVFLLLGIGIIVYAAIKFIGRDGEQIK
jgi:membrane-associated protein